MRPAMKIDKEHEIRQRHARLNDRLTVYIGLIAWMAFVVWCMAQGGNLS